MNPSGVDADTWGGCARVEVGNMATLLNLAVNQLKFTNFKRRKKAF